jgi:hypothetical protein
VNYNNTEKSMTELELKGNLSLSTRKNISDRENTE